MFFCNRFPLRERFPGTCPAPVVSSVTLFPQEFPLHYNQFMQYPIFNIAFYRKSSNFHFCPSRSLLLITFSLKIILSDARGYHLLFLIVNQHLLSCIAPVANGGQSVGFFDWQ